MNARETTTTATAPATPLRNAPAEADRRWGPAPRDSEFAAPVRNQTFTSKMHFIQYLIMCKLVLLDCGDSSSQNLTYLVEDSANYADNGPSCSYTICRSGDEICRIRLDFTVITFIHSYYRIIQFKTSLTLACRL